MPTFEITAPDGKVYEVEGPPGSTKEQALAQVKKKLNVKEEATLGHKIGAMTDAAAQAVTFNASDELAAGLKTGFGFLGDYDKAKAEEQARMEENRRLAPGYSAAGTVASLAIPSGVAMKGLQAAAKAPTLLGKAGQVAKAGAVNAGVGAGYGTLSRLGDDQEINPVGDAAAGLMFGAGGKLISSAAGKMFNKSEALKRSAREHYVAGKSEEAGNKFLKKKPVNVKVLEGLRKTLEGPTQNTKKMPVVKDAIHRVEELEKRVTDGEVLTMKQVNGLLADLNKGTFKTSREKSRTLRAKKHLQKNLKDMEPTAWLGDGNKALGGLDLEVSGAKGARSMHSDVMKARELKKALSSVKDIEGLDRILFNKKTMTGVSPKVKEMLMNAREDPSTIRSVVGFISRMTPMNIVFNLLRGNPGLAAAQAGAIGTGKLSRSKYSDDIMRQIDDEYLGKYKKLEGDRVPNLEPVTALTGMGLLGNFGE